MNPVVNRVIGLGEEWKNPLITLKKKSKKKKARSLTVSVNEKFMVEDEEERMDEILFSHSDHESERDKIKDDMRKNTVQILRAPTIRGKQARKGALPGW